MSLTYDALFPGRFIKAGEMDGKPATLTIADAYLDNIEGEDGREKPQAVVTFRETKREWALNKTNGQCLRAMFGDHVDDWVGKRVTLYPERDSSGLSESGVCLRVLGSPELDKPMKVQIKLPRRKPLDRVLKATGKAGKAAAYEEPAGAAETASGDAETVEDVVEAAKAVLGATEAPDDESPEEREFLAATDKAPSELAAEVAAKAAAKAEAATATRKQVAMLYTQQTANHVTDEARDAFLAEHFGVGGFEAVPKDRVDDVLAFLKSGGEV